MSEGEVEFQIEVPEPYRAAVQLGGDAFYAAIKLVEDGSEGSIERSQGNLCLLAWMLAYMDRSAMNTRKVNGGVGCTDLQGILMQAVGIAQVIEESVPQDLWKVKDWIQEEFEREAPDAGTDR